MRSFLRWAGHGDFGEVYLARVRRRRRGESDPEGPIVLVKALQSRPAHLQTEFAREAELHGLVPGHPSVAALLAHCHEQLPHLMVLEYTDWVSGGLHRYTNIRNTR